MRTYYVPQIQHHDSYDAKCQEFITGDDWFFLIGSRTLKEAKKTLKMSHYKNKRIEKITEITEYIYIK